MKSLKWQAKLAFLVAVLLCCVTRLPLVGGARLPTQPTDYRTLDWITEHPTTIAIYGVLPGFDIPELGVETSGMDILPSPDSLASALWVQSDLMNKLETSAQKEILQEWIADGKVVLFYDNPSNARVRQLFGATPIESLADPALSNVEQVGVYVWQDDRGTTQFGVVAVESGIPIDLIWESLVEATINHLDHINTSTGIRLDELTGPDEMLAYNEPTITHTGWEECVFLQQYTFTSWVGSKVNEWLQVSVNWDQEMATSDPQRYDVWAISSKLEPIPDPGYGTDYALIRYTEDVPEWQVLEYAPLPEPSAYTISWTLTSGDPPSLAYTTTYTVHDLTIKNASDSTRLVDITFDYNHATDYAKGVTWQAAGAIWRRPTASSLYIPSYRVVQWKKPFSFEEPHYTSCALRIGPFIRP